MRFFVYITLIAALLVSFVPAQAMLESTVVEPANMNGWGAYDDKVNVGGGRIDFMSGPGVAPLGSKGSAHFVIENSNAAWLLAAPVTPQTPLASITTLRYSTYTTSGGDALAVSLQLGIDYDATDANTGYQGRLVYEPYINGTVTKGTWQEWNAIADTAKWYGTRNDGLAQCPMANPCTWTQIKEKFPRAMFHATQMHSLIGLKAGGGWATFDGNADALVFGLNGVDTTYDFEPASTVYVDDDWGAVPYNTDPDGTGPAHLMGFDASATVQGGVKLVRSGGKVNIAEGIYTEQVLVNNLDGITIEGVGQDVVTIKATTKLVSTVGTDRKPVLFVGDSDNVTVKNLTLDGAGTSGYNNRLYGLFYHNSSGLIENVTSKAMRDEPLNGVQSGVGFYVYNTDPADLNTVTVRNCTAVDYQKGGFVFNGEGLTAIVEDNTATGIGPTPLIAMNGIQVGYSAHAVLTGNTITGHDYAPATPSNWSSAGILLYLASAEIDGNIIEDNQIGISADYSDFTAVQNYITGGEYGIGQNAGSSEIFGNNITSNDYGVDVYTYEPEPEQPLDTAEAVIKHNRFFNNTVGVANEIFAPTGEQAPTLDATDNWWSCNEGPNDEAGDCDTTLGNLNTATWLQLNLAADLGNVVEGKQAGLTVTLTRNNAGQVVSVPAVFPDGKNVTFATTSATSQFDSSSVALTAGSASAMLTLGPDDTLGAMTISVTLDNETVTLLKIALPILYNLSGN